MNLQIKLQLEIEAVKAASQELGFVANCDLDVANFCAVLARSVGGDWLEFGTGTGLSTLFLAEVLAGGRLNTVDNDADVSHAARGVIGAEKKYQFHYRGWRRVFEKLQAGNLLFHFCGCVAG